MKETSERELTEALAEPGRVAVFLHTPFCGTCKAVRRMVEIAEQLAPEGLTLVAGNVNLLPGLVQKYRISSVPALLVSDGSDSDEVRINYRLDSVQRIVELLRGE